jgi:hypothetical protein
MTWLPISASPDEPGADRVLDVGCGTGCLAVLLAAALAPSSVTSREPGPVDRHLEVTSVSLTLASFRSACRLPADGTELTSDSAIRSRSRDEVESSLATHGHRVLDV